jgi:hypothetical protein
VCMGPFRCYPENRLQRDKGDIWETSEEAGARYVPHELSRHPWEGLHQGHNGGHGHQKDIRILLITSDTQLRGPRLKADLLVHRTGGEDLN